MKRSSIGVCLWVLACGTLWASVALAQESANDTATLPPIAVTSVPPPQPSADLDGVTLRNGTTLYGRIAEMRSDGTVVLVTTDGVARMIPPVEVASTTLDTTRRAVAVNAENQPIAGPDLLLSPQPIPGRVPLEIESDGAPLSVSVPLARFYTMMGPISTGTMPNSGTCTTPCQVWVEPGNLSLRVGGYGRMQTSLSLVIEPGVGRRMRFRSSSAPAFTWSRQFLILGGGAIVLGVVAAAAGSGGPFGSSGGQLSPWEIFGIAAVSAGVLLVGVSLPMMLHNRPGLISSRPIGASARRWNPTVRLAVDIRSVGVVAGAVF